MKRLLSILAGEAKESVESVGKNINFYATVVATL